MSGKCPDCGKTIEWYKTGSGRIFPFDPEPVRFETMGSKRFLTLGGYFVKGERSETGNATGYICHFDTCTGYTAAQEGVNR